MSEKVQTTVPVDRFFLVVTGILIVLGVLFFCSGAFFLFSSKSSLFWGTLARHLGLGLGGGGLFYILIRRVPLAVLMNIAPYIGAFSVLFTLLVFVPQLGVAHGFATRWISIGGFELQPGESLKLGALLISAWWFARHRALAHTVSHGLVPYLCIIGVVGAALLLQPDTDSFLVIAFAVTAVYLSAGASWKHIAFVALFAVMLGGGLIATSTHVRQRVMTFINPSSDPLGTSFHVRQSLIAIGSGQITGRGYGRGVHKYQYLPEPMGDTIYAVIGEETGFIGTSVVATLFFLWYMRAVILSHRLHSFFARYTVFGLAHIVLVQAFLNILSNIGLFPFSGLPLPFMSQGGTALFVLICSIAVMSVCMTQRTPKKGVL